MNNSKTKRIETVLKKEIYHNQENGYTVFEDIQGRVFTGYLMNKPEKLKDINLIIQYKKVKTKYGIQYQIREIEYKVPPLYHFLTGVIKGVQKKAAIELAEKYQNIQNLEKVLYSNEKEILNIKGIGPKSIEKLKEGMENDRELYELAEILLPYGISSNIIRKIYSKYKDFSIIKKLKEDPYRILTSVRGIGFKKADSIALKAKLAERNSIYRAKAAIIYVIEQLLSEEGESVFSKENIKTKFYELVSEKDLNVEKFEEAFNILLEEGKIIEVNKKNSEYTLNFTHRMELEIFEFVKQDSFNFLYNDEMVFVENFIKKYEEKNKIKLDGNQRKAVIEFLIRECPVYIIAGYAGTGKTTTSKALVEFLKEKNKNIVGCALSGAAANRLKSVAGIESYTIHSLLGYKRGKGNEESLYEDMFKYNSKNKLDYDLIIVDEASMVSAPLFYHLMKAVDTKRTKILMLGDDAQLPPVGWGEVFVDLLNYDKVPKTKLTKIYRQSEDKVIALFAGEIRKGNVPKDFKENKFSDFHFVPINIPFKLADLPVEKNLARKYLLTLILSDKCVVSIAFSNVESSAKAKSAYPVERVKIIKSPYFLNKSNFIINK
jgi:exodeoxyribonuclease V alpha subunit